MAQSDSQDYKVMDFILSDGKTMSYSDKGVGETVFLLIHGGGGDRSHLQPQFEFLSKLSRTINVDLRGYGKSELLNVYGSIEQYSKDLFELMLYLNINKVILVGHSMGGMVAVEFAATHPELTTAVIMISSGIIFPKVAHDDEQQFLNEFGGDNFNESLSRLVSQLLPFDSCVEHIRKTFFAVSQKQWISHFKEMMKWDKIAPERLSHCKTDMLYIEDSGGCYSDINRLKSICPQLMLGKTVGSGHFPTIEVPEQVNFMIQQFYKVNNLIKL